ncbi:MAG: hypothetical protein WCE73_15190 [Candidatus Angelobacter sp.]|jgi:hypothetical protein
MVENSVFRICFTLFVATIFSSALSGQDKQFTDDWAKGANSPGSTLTLKETGRDVVEGNTVVSYRLFASGLPKGQHFTLWMWTLGSEPQAVADAFINPDGLVVNRLADVTHNVSEDPINLRMLAGRGERKRVALTSDDWTLQAFAGAIPFPIEKSANGCSLSVEISAPDYAGVILRGSGFQPSELLTVETASGAEGGKQQTTATPAGTYTAVIFPRVKGQKSGKASVTISSPSCKVALQFPWGDGSYKIQ